MQLISLEFEDPQAGWRLSHADFFKDITLLVGLSGVGKTRILDSIRYLKDIANGKSSKRFFGLKWHLKFIQDDISFEWFGEFQKLQATEGGADYLSFMFDENEDDAYRPNLILERLARNNNIIAERDENGIRLYDQTTPKLSNKESLISILRNEEQISVAFHGMNAMLFVDHSEEHRSGRYMPYIKHFEKLTKNSSTIEEIRSLESPTHIKLALAYQNCREVFDEISNQFQEAFPYVKDMSFKFIEIGSFGIIPRLYITEVGVANPIPEESISSGMYRTLMHLSRVALWPDGTVILVDEFENSFGVNCIHFVTQDLQVHSRRMQFILTSHHPYIINNISMKNWKIVSRIGQTVVVEGAERLQKSASHHEAFLQLLNLPQYAEGIATE